ncbi:MAG: tetratricopeptide repeat protein [Gammaproteobacteria bacterium]|nr:tetratricopeptide repeat protein [Gammaproteobacteria bacterium]
MAQFDLERDKTFTLKRSGEVLSAETIRNPVIVFANYVFDTTRQDLFRIERGQLREGLITSVSEREQEPDLTDPQLIERITNRYEYRPLEADYYEDPILNQILQAYEERLNDTTILFPISALDCIRRLIDLAGGRLLLLSSDKGHAYEDELISLKGPYIARHGSFSMMVNYHAIERYFRHRGGMALHASPRGNASLTTSAFFLDGAPATGSEVQREFQEAINGFGPTDFYNLVGSTHKKSASLQLILSLLRLSGWDTSLILRFKEALIDQVETVTESLKRELRWAIDRVWDNYFPIDEKEDLPFELARIFYAMNRSHDALRYGEHSIRLFGEHYVTLYNMGLSYYRLEQLPEALRYFNRALELEPAYGPARGWRIRVQAELDGDVGSGDLSVLPEIKSEILRGSTTLNQNGSNEREEKIDLKPVKVGVS